MRTIAGSPGAGGFAISFGSKTDVLLVWEDEGKRHTSTYIDDPKWKLSISEAGDKCVDELSSKENGMRISGKQLLKIL